MSIPSLGTESVYELTPLGVARGIRTRFRLVQLQEERIEVPGFAGAGESVRRG